MPFFEQLHPQRAAQWQRSAHFNRQSDWLLRDWRWHHCQEKKKKKQTRPFQKYVQVSCSHWNAVSHPEFLILSLQLKRVFTSVYCIIVWSATFPLLWKIITHELWFSCCPAQVGKWWELCKVPRLLLLKKRLRYRIGRAALCVDQRDFQGLCERHGN